jgi:hypothetical protein
VEALARPKATQPPVPVPTPTAQDAGEVAVAQLAKTLLDLAGD